MSTIDLSRPTRNITIDQGSTITLNFALTTNSVAMNLSGYDLRLQVRRTLADTSTVLNCTLANGKLAWIAQTSGTFNLVLTPADTSSIRFLIGEDSIDGVYDLEIQDASGAVSKPCGGSFIINREATR